MMTTQKEQMKIIFKGQVEENLALDLCYYLHDGQYDKAGQPYYKHPIYVMEHVSTHEEKVVALLHDTIEDTRFTLECAAVLFEPEIVDALDAVTRRKDETYMDYIRRCKENEIARVVKIEDLKHNMQPDRIPHPTEADYRRVKKYAKALKILEKE